MPDEEVRITLRLPASLRDKLLSSADDRSRSMNGEIVERLDWSFERATAEKESLLKLIHEQDSELRSLREKLAQSDLRVEPKALADAYAFAEDLRNRCEKQWYYLQDQEAKLRADRRAFDDQMAEKRKELSDYMRERRKQAREFFAERDATIKERSKFLEKRERELDEVIATYMKREQELGELIKTLTSGVVHSAKN